MPRPNSNNNNNNNNNNNEKKPPAKPARRSRSPRPKAPPASATLRRRCSLLLGHTFMMGEKFVKREKAVLGNQIKDAAVHILRLAISIDSYHNRHRRLELYLAMDCDLKFLSELVLIAYDRRCISSSNRDAWVGMATEIDNIVMSQVLKIDKEKKNEDPKKSI